MASEWVRYRRSGDVPLEAMHARFERHVYHRHSHDTSSFGVTEAGAQSFACRGGWHTSAAGMVMTFNPDDPHDGRSADDAGFTYRMIHIGTPLLATVATDALGLRPRGLLLFDRPVREDARVAAALRRLHRAVLGPASALRRDEHLAAAVAALNRLATRPAWPDTRPGSGRIPGPGSRYAHRLAALARDVLEDHKLVDVGASDLARLIGQSRFAIYRAFRQEYGMSPSDYQRQVRLRRAHDLLASAVDSGFADQAHLNRWFVRHYGITPGTSRRAAGPGR